MRAVLQRVSEASVVIDGQQFSSINSGLLILLGVEDNDDNEDIEWLTNKIAGLRLFNDEDGLMNLSVQDINGQCLVISQFTLFAQCKKGKRPSYIKASKPPIAIPLYEQFITRLQELIQKPIETGQFGADMKVHLINDGPVTIFLDTKQKDL